MLKKILSCVLLTVLLLTCLAGCGEDDGVPDGMYSATVGGEPFILYVPEGWTDNRDSGISSAYYSLSDAVMASARYYTPEMTENFSLGKYIYDFTIEFSKANPSFEKRAEEDSTLGDQKAVRLQYTFDRTIDGTSGEVTANVIVTQYYVIHGSDVVVLSLFCDSSKYNEEYIAMFEQIRTEFVFCDKAETKDGVVDKNTPEGMKRVSFDDCEFLFYAPTSWRCDMSDKLSEAYYPESGKPNVTVTSFSPDSKATPDQYFAMCEEVYKKDIPGYEKLSEEARTVAGCSAKSYTYKAVYGGTQTEYRIMQTVIAYDDMIYSITYTALADSFDAHLGDVSAMLDAFRFR